MHTWDVSRLNLEDVHLIGILNCKFLAFYGFGGLHLIGRLWFFPIGRLWFFMCRTTFGDCVMTDGLVSVFIFLCVLMSWFLRGCL